MMCMPPNTTSCWLNAPSQHRILATTTTTTIATAATTHHHHHPQSKVLNETKRERDDALKQLEETRGTLNALTAQRQEGAPPRCAGGIGTGGEESLPC